MSIFWLAGLWQNSVSIFWLAAAGLWLAVARAVDAEPRGDFGKLLGGTAWVGFVLCLVKWAWATKLIP